MYKSFMKSVAESGSSLKLIHHLSSYMSALLHFTGWPHGYVRRSTWFDWKWIIAYLDCYLSNVYSTGAYNLCVCVQDCTLLSLSVFPPSFLIVLLPSLSINCRL